MNKRPFQPSQYPICRDCFGELAFLLGECGIETEGYAKNRLHHHVQLLRMKGAGPDANELADRIEPGIYGYPADSGACPLSMYFLRVLLVDQFRQFMPTNGSAISIVLPGTAVPMGKLHTLNLSALESRVRRLLRKTSLQDQPLIGGWDLSLNEAAGTKSSLHWAPQLFIVAPYLTDRLRARKEFSGLLIPNQDTPRPIKISPLTDPFGAVTYSMKSSFYRRISYIDKNGRRNTRHLPLRPFQERELLLFLDQIGIAARLFLLNVRRRGYQLVVEPSVSSPIRDASKNPGKVAKKH